MRTARFERDQPPRMRRTNMPRPRMMNLLSDIPDYPVTVVKAGAGYGKTTAVANYLHQSGLRKRWLTLSAEDRDTTLFVRRILLSLLPKHVSSEELEAVVLASHSPITWMATALSAATLISYYLQEETILVLDDFHVIQDEVALQSWMDAWMQEIPQHLHIVFITRTKPTLPHLQQLMLRGEVLMIRERDLVFDEDEIAALFRLNAEQNAPELNSRQIHYLLEWTGGMALVLSMLLREWRNTPSFLRLQELLSQETSLLDQIGRLFEIGLSTEEQEFFRSTSVLTTLHPDICNDLLHRTDSQQILSEVERRGHILHVAESADYEVHPLVREYLLRKLSESQRKRLLERAIHWYQEKGDETRSIGYIFDLPDKKDQAVRLFPLITRYIEKGQLSTVQAWLDRLSPVPYEYSARWIWAQAEVDRLSNRFTQAQVRYEKSKQIAKTMGDQTSIADAFIGLGQLYLDTIQPKPAAHVIREARNVIPRRFTKHRIIRIQLAFENAINSGKPLRAKRLLHNLIQMGIGAPPNNSDLRLLLRTGHVREALTQVKRRLIKNDTEVRTSLAHRETSLLFSLLCSMLGDPDTAKLEAERGRWIADSLNAPFVRAVGFIRLGHAQHLAQPFEEEALTSYETAIGLMDEMDVARGKSEALLGLCLAHGYRGKFPLAKLYAEQGIALAAQAGDLWMENLVRTAYGQICTIHGYHHLANKELTHAMQAFIDCGDLFMHNAAQLWNIFTLHALNDQKWHEELDDLLRSEFTLSRLELLSKPTLFGMKDVQRIVPLLLEQKQSQSIEQELTIRLLEVLDAHQIEHHPGYTLYVQTFGTFEVYRGFTKVTRREWQREKARQLFQFLVTHRGSWFHREEICDRLWGDLSPDTAERDFKVALNVLSAALEPKRPERSTTVFIVRQGSLYSLTMHPMLQIDRDLFLNKIREADGTRDPHRQRRLLAVALQLYRGAYLEEARYEPWCEDERERLRLLYLRAATKYSRLCLDAEDWEDAIQTCENLLQWEAAWEDAYIDLMEAYAHLGNRSMVIQTYLLCQRALQREVGISVSERTTTLFRQLIPEKDYKELS
ncbi:BTAD domain-containing putative transcriptional regulator [Sulfoacidibacillus thermotolerans]|uniref:Bacterial transcriptional activator domain-containing protein n=1 Tax=Sulfoacidibacillus thermotolerans TaxID=1765684 RepID=A0A2U3D8G1_SULT2|nr:BTAD domain-containing putative transcriptional regulator [Sulfoacidibacillus thermotolerans]PWI57562.1 hypothetical protein BM613_08050 [Sulfoacidibacillus thermotolerans]